MRYDAHTPLIDAIGDEADALMARTPPRRLAPSLEQRAHDLAPGAVGRAAWLSHAGEVWEQAGERERARACYEEAASDGGPAWLDPRASLVSVLLDLGDNPAAEEHLRALRRDLSLHGARGPVHDFVGEALEEHGRLGEALRWFDAGITYLEREDPDGDHGSCLHGRYRVRRELGLAIDRYDLLAEELREEARSRYDDEALDDLVDARVRPSAVTALHWPADQLAGVLSRWPEIAVDYGTDHDAHRRLVEQQLRQLTEHASQVSVADGELDDLLAFAARRLDDPTAASTRAEYAAELARVGRAQAWPPGRNDPCWCGSGVKYKKCCGAPTRD